MSTYDKERSMEETPTWAVAVVCVVLLVISFFIEHVIHHIEKVLKNKNKRALYEAVEKVKAELMLLGFLSLLLTVFDKPISAICVPKSIGNSWHPCNKEPKTKDDGTNDKCTKNDSGKVAFVSSYAIYQLHKFIFVLACFHVLYCIITLFLGRSKMKKWQVWEDETKTAEYQYSHDPERFRFTRDTSFGRRHLNSWSQSPLLLWIVCFFRQFVKSVDKVDYLTLRHGFITAHLAPGSETKFDFQKYIKRSLEEDFTVVVGISPIIWFFAVLFLLSNTHGWYAYLWLPFIPLIVIMLVGAKLQVIITKMGLRIQERGDVVRGAPVVEPGDDLFWFNRPGFMLFLINLVLFQNAFQLAFFAWSTYEFGFRSCYHQPIEDIVIRLTMGVVIQFLCSYVTLPLYALVTQMGSNMKPAIFNDRVADAVRSWHHTAREHTKHNRSENVTPLSSRPGSPTHGMSPVHLLHKYRQDNSYKNSPRTSNLDVTDHWDAEGSTTPFNHDSVDSDQPIIGQLDVGEQPRQSTVEMSSTQLRSGSRAIRTQHEIDMNSSKFSFDKSRTG